MFNNTGSLDKDIENISKTLLNWDQEKSEKKL